jgi:hypothetical protein
MFGKILNLIHTRKGKIFISILIGLGLASLFRKSCENRECIAFHAPKTKDVEKNIYRHDNRCYKFTATSVSCNNDNTKRVRFA